MSDPAGARVALYWAPAVDDPLHRIGSEWLGRDAETGATVEQPVVEGVDLREVTRDARRYGLHATMKPPFRLAHGYSALRLDAERLAARTKPFALPPLEVTSFGGFLALRESVPCPPLNAFADACVEAVDRNRVPPDAAEIARRRPERMTEAQRANMRRWGYHYVVAEWFFHVTLTRRLSEAEDAVVRPVVDARFAEVAGRSRRVTELCLFTQAQPDEPFLVAERLALLG